VTVPYVQGDSDGSLTNELIRALAASGTFECVRQGGRYVLKVAVTADSSQRIGSRYDREDPSGKLKKNLIPTESRRTLTAEVSLIDAATDEILVGPAVVEACAEYDYVDSSSITDLSFVDPGGGRRTVINFSLGQLDSIEGAQDDASAPLYRRLAQKIVDSLTNQI
jgi:hypothetical protein